MRSEPKYEIYVRTNEFYDFLTFKSHEQRIVFEQLVVVLFGAEPSLFRFTEEEMKQRTIGYVVVESTRKVCNLISSAGGLIMEASATLAAGLDSTARDAAEATPDHQGEREGYRELLARKVASISGTLRDHYGESWRERVLDCVPNFGEGTNANDPSMRPFGDYVDRIAREIYFLEDFGKAFPNLNQYMNLIKPSAHGPDGDYLPDLGFSASYIVSGTRPSETAESDSIQRERLREIVLEDLLNDATLGLGDRLYFFRNHKYEIHLCDTILNAYEISTIRRSEVHQSQPFHRMIMKTRGFSSKELQAYEMLPRLAFDIDVKISCPANTLRQVTSRVTSIAKLGYGRESVLRQNLGKPIVSSSFDKKTWESFNPAVRSFLMDAACRAGQEHLKVRRPGFPSKADLTELLSSFDPNRTVPSGLDAAKFNNMLVQLGLEGYEGQVEKSKVLAQRNLLELLYNFYYYNYDIDYDETIYMDSILSLQPLHKRVLGLLEYDIMSRPGSDTGLHKRVKTLIEYKNEQFSYKNEDKNVEDHFLNTWFRTARLSQGDLRLSALLEAVYDESALQEISIQSDDWLHPEMYHTLPLLKDLRSGEQAQLRLVLLVVRTVFEIRNFIEHGIDEVGSGFLRIRNEGFWNISHKGRSRSEQTRLSKVDREFVRNSTRNNAENCLLIDGSSLRYCIALCSVGLRALRLLSSLPANSKR